jgi:hypothetical protein
MCGEGKQRPGSLLHEIEAIKGAAPTERAANRTQRQTHGPSEYNARGSATVVALVKRTSVEQPREGEPSAIEHGPELGEVEVGNVGPNAAKLWLSEHDRVVSVTASCQRHEYRY